MNKEKKMTIIAQGLYGNRMMTFIDPEHFDALMLGYLDMNAYESMRDKEKVDRTIIRVPDTENLVLVYNRFREEKRLRRGEELLREEGYEIKPLAIVPELNLTLYSRCIALRMNEQGEFGSLQEGDGEFIEKYLAR